MATVSIETIRGQRKFIDNGYQFVRDKTSKNGVIIFWRCDQRNNGCKARLHTDAATDRITNRMHDHNHGSNAAAIEVNVVRTAMKRRAETTTEVRIIFFIYLFS